MDPIKSHYTLFTAMFQQWGDGSRFVHWDRPVKHIHNNPTQHALLQDAKFVEAIGRLRKSKTIRRIKVRGPFTACTLYPWIKN